MQIDEPSTFYFIAHPRGIESKITVIDLSYAASHERGEFCAVNDADYQDLNEALDDAKKIAFKFNLEYQRFESRYNSSLNEKINLEP